MTSDPLVALAEIDPAFVAWLLAGLFFLFVLMMLPRGEAGEPRARVVVVDDDEDVIRGLRFLIEGRTRMDEASAHLVKGDPPDVIVRTLLDWG